MGNGLKRNKPCWCQSGLKYKNCHFERDTQPPLSFEEKLKDLNTSFKKSYCIHPNKGAECNGGIIRAHTIQRSGGLTTIARQNHVYTLIPGEAELMKKGMPAPKLAGLRNASTFTGFCNYHDTTTFRPIEINSFQATEEHSFLLAYRAICRELFLKRARVEHLEKARKYDQGSDIMKQLYWQGFIKNHLGAERSTLKYLETDKVAYDQCLTSNNFSQVQYYIIRINSTPDFMFSGSVMPDYDFSGAKIQDLTDYNQKPDLVNVSLINTDTGGAIVFSWVGKNKAAEQLLRSLHALNDNEICHAIVRFSFEYIENIFLSPNWWEGLNNEERDSLINRMASGIRPDKLRKPDCLQDDSIRVVNWQVTNRETNFDLNQP